MITRTHARMHRMCIPPSPPSSSSSFCLFLSVFLSVFLSSFFLFLLISLSHTHFTYPSTHAHVYLHFVYLYVCVWCVQFCIISPRALSMYQTGSGRQRLGQDHRWMEDRLVYRRMHATVPDRATRLPGEHTRHVPSPPCLCVDGGR